MQRSYNVQAFISPIFPYTFTRHDNINQMGPLKTQERGPKPRVTVQQCNEKKKGIDRWPMRSFVALWRIPRIPATHLQEKRDGKVTCFQGARLSSNLASPRYSSRSTSLRALEVIARYRIASLYSKDDSLARRESLSRCFLFEVSLCFLGLEKVSAQNIFWRTEEVGLKEW